MNAVVEADLLSKGVQQDGCSKALQASGSSGRGTEQQESQLRLAQQDAMRVQQQAVPEPESINCRQHFHVLRLCTSASVNSG